MILESGFSSASDLASSALPLLPRRLHFLAKNRFETGRKLSKVTCPVLITHGDPDSTIPTEHGHAYRGCKRTKETASLSWSRHNVFGSQGNEYLDLIADFV